MNRRHSLQILVPCMLVGALWVVLAWLPASGRLEDASARLAQAEDQISVQSQELVSLRLLPGEQEATLHNAALAELAIPQLAGLGQFLRDLDSLADQSGLEIESLTPTDVHNAGTAPEGEELPVGVSSVGYRMVGLGDYTDVLEFLDRLRSTDRLVLLDELELSAGSDDQLVLSIEFRVFTTDLLIEPDESEVDSPKALAFDTDSSGEE